MVGLKILTDCWQVAKFRFIKFREKFKQIQVIKFYYNDYSLYQTLFFSCLPVFNTVLFCHIASCIERENNTTAITTNIQMPYTYIQQQ
ncbi:hypothetical protein DOY81_006316 [Sarcophaga bullata]|nr:hypothetical protein DOY81_006316 [Sarcophaga bullata]